MELRKSETEDEGFLYELYASVREEEMRLWGFSKPEREAFLRMQWTMQARSYGLQAPDADSLLICIGGRRIGRMLVHRAGSFVRLMDIALLPENRGQGIGTQALRRLMGECGASGKPLLLSVNPINPALALYERLGFSPQRKTETCWELSWQPPIPK
ncbi:GNAT family N-acetyltransferase [Paenibacillus albicereus]|uniref:GNAT family N-acetyltransferase n=1 Tax=Paenibacillus albicereus TaxID=2726185 RepID=A0A6H2GYJ8_9BACL|nr:GNAT family N-acetyltransferase [Paenibacillus albicereus]QJC52513.1 GNAT family N-acetyltransferase [Paenibacillus albicereus]